MPSSNTAETVLARLSAQTPAIQESTMTTRGQPGSILTGRNSVTSGTRSAVVLALSSTP